MEAIEPRRNRRSLLGLGAATAAAMGLATLGRPAEAGASNPLELGSAANDAGSDPTFTTADVSGPDAAFTFTNSSGTGPALLANSSAVGGAPNQGPIGAIVGATDSGWGVAGRTHTGIGVFGGADDAGGIGVQGFGETGVLATGDKTALKVEGVARFTQAGTTTVTAGAKAKTVTVTGLVVNQGAAILATVQGLPGSVHVVSARRIGAAKIRVYLNEAAPVGGIRVGYFVVN